MAKTMVKIRMLRKANAPKTTAARARPLGGAPPPERQPVMAPAAPNSPTSSQMGPSTESTVNTSQRTAAPTARPSARLTSDGFPGQWETSRYSSSGPP